jgi:hypothetical protein
VSGDGIFSLGLIGPLALLFLGSLAIGLLVSGVVIVVRLRADSKLLSTKSQSQIDSSIALFVISESLSVIGGIIFRNGEYGAGIKFAIAGIFILWPVSAVLAIVGRGVGRKVLLIGHALIALWVVVLVLIMSIYVLRSRLMIH